MSNRPEVLVVIAHGSTLPDGDSSLFTVGAGPFGERFVEVSERLVHGLSGLIGHALR
jgi:hypothetical protein